MALITGTVWKPGPTSAIMAHNSALLPTTKIGLATTLLPTRLAEWPHKWGYFTHCTEAQVPFGNSAKSVRWGGKESRLIYTYT